MSTQADPGPRYDIDMYEQGHTVKNAPKLPLNLLDAIRGFERDEILTGALGMEFSKSYVKMKTIEWNAYSAHLSEWERQNTLDV